MGAFLDPVFYLDMFEKKGITIIRFQPSFNIKGNPVKTGSEPVAVIGGERHKMPLSI